jgi:hypothetical protein
VPNEQVSLRPDEVLEGLEQITGECRRIPAAGEIVQAAGPGIGATAEFYAHVVRSLQAAAAATAAVVNQVEQTRRSALLAVEELHDTNRVTAEQAAEYTARLEAMSLSVATPSTPPAAVSPTPKPASHSW